VVQGINGHDKCGITSLLWEKYRAICQIGVCSHI